MPAALGAALTAAGRGAGSTGARLALLAGIGSVAALAGLAIGAARVGAIDAGAFQGSAAEMVSARGFVEAVPRRSDGEVRVRVATADGRLLVVAPEPVADLPVGREIAARGRVREPGDFEAAYLARLGIQRIVDARSIALTGRRRGGLAGLVDQLRRRAEAALERGTPEAEAALLRGFVLGQDDRIDPATVDDFQRSGLAHLLIYYDMAITTPTTNQPLRLDAYLRVSRTNGRAGDSFISPKQQHDKIAAWAKLRGVRIAKWHEPDLDQSGGKLSRPNFDKALERIQAKQTGGIVVAKLDRFSRAGVADALTLIESIHQADGQVASVEENIDPTTPAGEFALTLFLALARMQRAQIAEAWNDSRRRAVERGVHISSKVPTGYRGTVVGHNGRGQPIAGPLEKDEGTEPHIAEVFRMKAQGASWRELGDYLRNHDVATPYGTTHWQPRALSHVISNSVYLGEARSGEFTNPKAHDPIVDEATWKAAQNAKGERPVNGMGGALLAGVLRCAGCGYVLKPDTMKDRNGEKLRLYRCRTQRSEGR
ncbi:MAG: recombinase family protein, partial [bacterium]